MADAMNSALGGFPSGMPWQGGSQDPLLGMFGGLAAQQQQQSLKWRRYKPLTEGVIPFKYGRQGERVPLTFIEKLRNEIDDWLNF